MNSKGNVLFLSYDGMTDPLGQSQVIPYLSGLSAAGYSISIISFEKSSRFQEGADQIQTILDNASIDWHPLHYTKNPPILSTIFDLWRMRRKAYEIHKSTPLDIIHCRSYIASLVGLYFKKKYHIKYIFDMRGLWADERVDGGLWNLKKPIYKIIYNFFKAREKDFVLHSDVTISLTEKAKSYLLDSVKGGKEINVQVIPCCTDLNLFKVVDQSTKTSLLRDIDIPEDSFIVTYLGSVGTWYMLDEMLIFFNKLLQSRQNSVFLFVTQDDPELIFKRSDYFLIDRTSIRIVAASRKEVPDYLSITYIALFFIKPLFSKIASSPTKLGEFLSCGIPVITNSEVGDTEEIVSANGVGYIFKDFTDQSMEECIEHIDVMMQIPKSKMMTVALQNFSLEDGIVKYKNIYDELLSSR